MHRKYEIALYLSITIFIILALQNYRSGQRLSQVIKNAELTEKDKTNKTVALSKYGYADIIEALDKIDNMKIKKIDKDKENNVAIVQVELLGDIYAVEKELKCLKDKGNFQKMNSLLLEKSDGSVTSRINMSFINNR